MENPELADRLDTFASLLELNEANPYTARAYRRAAETIRGSPSSVADLVRSERVRELRGIGDVLPHPPGTLADAVEAAARAHGEKAGLMLRRFAEDEVPRAVAGGRSMSM